MYNKCQQYRFGVQFTAMWFLVFMAHMFLPAFLMCFTTVYLGCVLDGRFPCIMWVLLCTEGMRVPLLGMLDI